MTPVICDNPKCMMETKINETHDLAVKIHKALVGDEEMGHRGLIKRVKCLEDYRFKLIVWTAGILGGGTVTAWLINMIFPHLLTKLFQ